MSDEDDATDRASETFRVEHDALGDVLVPASALFGAQTQRGRTNFRVSGVTLQARPELISAFGKVKVAAALANAALGELAAPISGVVVEAGREVAANHLDQHFPLDVVQGGGGTATNMNVNEVIANRAAEMLGGARGTYDLVHPNDHVNRSQSTNDVYPTALRIAVISQSRQAIAGLRHLAEAIRADSVKAGHLVRLGRTCLQDALPVEVSATQNGEARALDRTIRGLVSACDQLFSVPLGATAVGTGLGAPTGYRELAVDCLADETGMPLTIVDDAYDSLAHIDEYVSVTSSLVSAMLVMAKVANDLRLLSSGPLGGIAEVRLPAVQVGSSIMPGKVNPVIPELVMQVAFEVRGAANIVEAAAAAGELELNVMEPVVARHLLGALHDVATVSRLFADRCIAGLEWQKATIARHLSGSLADRVDLARTDGYAAAVRNSRFGTGA